MNTNKISAQVSIIFFTCSILGYLYNYTKSFTKKSDFILLEKKVNTLELNCKNLTEIYKMKNIQERIQELEDKYPEENKPQSIKNELRYLKEELSDLATRYIK